MPEKNCDPVILKMAGSFHGLINDKNKKPYNQQELLIYKVFRMVEIVGFEPMTS